jgi:thioredoxin 1
MATKTAIEITDANFEEVVLKSDKPVMVDFWAQWCGPCLQIAPMIEELAEEFQGQVVIGKMDVDNNPNIPTQFDIRSIPTLMFFKNGQMVDKQVGAIPKAALVKKLNSHLA